MGAVVLAVSPVLADDTTSGHVGAYLFTDDSGTPGARCNYVGDGEGLPSSGTIMGFSALQPPTVYAEDKTPGTDTQTVGWRVIVRKFRTDTSTWKVLYRSQVMKATATDTTPAAFSIARADPTMNGHIPANYYVSIKALWYGSKGSKVGQATHEVANYTEVFEGWLSKFVTPCSNAFPA
jgi:hypothetical protein